MLPNLVLHDAYIPIIFNMSATPAHDLACLQVKGLLQVDFQMTSNVLVPSPCFGMLPGLGLQCGIHLYTPITFNTWAGLLVIMYISKLHSQVLS